jgi:WD40 repeat protein
MQRPYCCLLLCTGLIFALIRAAPSADPPALRNRPGDALPSGAVVRLSTAGRRPAGYVSCVRFSPDGRILTAGSEDCICLWDLAAPSVPRQFQGHRRRIWSVAFSPDGKLMASGSSDQTVRLWETATGRPVHTLSRHQAPVRAVDFSPDGRLLASAGEDGLVQLWNVGTGKEVGSLTGHQGPVRTVAFAPDGKRLASGGDDRTIRLWDVATGKEVRQLTGHEDWVRSVVFSPDGKTLASAGDDRTVRQWSVTTGKTLRKLQGHSGKVFAVAFSPDGHDLASGSPDYTTRLWEIATGREIRSVVGHQDWVVGVAVAPDGLGMASGSADGTVVLWDLRGGSRSGPTPELQEKDVPTCWASLAGEDAAQADRAIWMLVERARQAVPYLRERLRPADRADPQRVAQLVHDLDSGRFAARQQATQELERLGPVSVAALEHLLQAKPSLEARRRAEAILEKLEGGVPSPEQLRTVRSLQVLERIGSPEAQEALKSLAAGAPGAWLTQEAKAVLERLNRRAAVRH